MVAAQGALTTGMVSAQAILGRTPDALHQLSCSVLLHWLAYQWQSQAVFATPTLPIEFDGCDPSRISQLLSYHERAVDLSAVNSEGLPALVAAIDARIFRKPPPTCSDPQLAESLWKAISAIVVDSRKNLNTMLISVWEEIASLAYQHL